MAKRTKRKGGSWSQRQTIFTPPAEAFTNLDPMFSRYRDSCGHPAIRISIKIEWKPVDTAVEINTQTLAKEKLSNRDEKWLKSIEDYVHKTNLALKASA